MKTIEVIAKLPDPGPYAEWISVSQIVANVAVIIAIAVAILQLRTSHSNASSSAEQFHTQAMHEFWMTLAANDELAYIYKRGRADPTSLNEKEKVRFFYAAITWFSQQEFMFSQASKGRVGESFYKEWEEAVKDDMTDPGFQEVWSVERLFFDEGFRGFIDGLIVEETEGA